jgi:hypothetical protein
MIAPTPAPTDYRIAVLMLEQYWLWHALSQRPWGVGPTIEQERREDLTRVLAARLGVR